MKIRASNGYQAWLCPGSVRAQDGLPEIASTGVTLSGTKVHAADAGDDIDLNSAEEVSLETVQTKREKLAAPLREGFTLLELIREADYTYSHFTGHPDYVEIMDSEGEDRLRALIFDTKTGWREQTEPAANLQVRIYAYLVFRKHVFIDEIVAGLVPSRFKTPAPVIYTRADILTIEDELVSIYAAASDPNAKRIPSEEACRYCRARATDRCPETIPMNTQLFKTPSESLLTTLTPQQKSRLLTECEILAGNIKIVKDRLKAEVEADANAIPGWYLKPGNVIGKIVDAQKTFEIVEPIFKDYVTADTVAEEDAAVMAIFQKCVTVNKGSLEAALSEAIGLKGKALDDRFDQLFSSVIVETQNKPSLSKMSKAMLKEKGNYD